MPTTVLYPCLTCGKTSKNKSDLKKHYTSVHKMPDHAAKAMLMTPSWSAFSRLAGLRSYIILNANELFFEFINFELEVFVY